MKIMMDAHMGNQPGLGIELTDDVRNRFPFIPGSGEFNNVPGKSQDDWDERVAEVADPGQW